jgi:large subunit ribosomal protein L32
MAEQKQKLSRSRSRKRRAEDKKTPKKLISCYKCKSKIPAHTVCPVCGNYKNQQIIKSTSIKTSVKDKSKKAEEK